jgi:hypothetical protein
MGVDKQKNKELTKRELLDSLIPDVTARDAQVAATIIQWLGSPAGENDHKEMLAEAKKQTPIL